MARLQNKRRPNDRMTAAEALALRDRLVNDWGFARGDLKKAGKLLIKGNTSNAEAALVIVAICRRFPKR